LDVALDSGFENAVCTDLTRPPKAVTRGLPAIANYSLDGGYTSCFFSGNKMAAICAEGASEIDIVDLVNDVQLAVIPIPQSDLLATVAFADGKHVAAAFFDGRVRVFDLVGSNSRWGLLASPWFFAAALAMGLIVQSLWSDARRRSTRPDNSLAAAAVVWAGAAALFALLVFYSACTPSAQFNAEFFGISWQVIAVCMPIGLCIRAGSRGWAVVGAVVLLYSAYETWNLNQYLATGADVPLQIFDRIWLISGAAARQINLAISAACILLCLFLIIESLQSWLAKHPEKAMGAI
jgi:hypothetical protein